MGEWVPIHKKDLRNHIGGLRLIVIDSLMKAELLSITINHKTKECTVAATDTRSILNYLNEDAPFGLSSRITIRGEACIAMG